MIQLQYNIVNYTYLPIKSDFVTCLRERVLFFIAHLLYLRFIYMLHNIIVLKNVRNDVNYNVRYVNY